MTTSQQEKRREALQRAEQGGSVYNYQTIIDGFCAKGIEEDDILPRENVLTYNAWLAKGRRVRYGEHGVKVEIFLPAKRGEEDGEERHFKVRKYTTVFHISQTEPANARQDS